MSLEVINNATCTYCGCLCDDIQLLHDGRRIQQAERACARGAAWFQGYAAEEKQPDALIDGRPASLAFAIETAATLLHQADMPLIYGMSNATCEAQQECAALADQLGGLLDSPRHGCSELAMQLGGKVTCTLGEVKQRADFVLYWGSNPVESLPRHFSKYTVHPSSKFLPRGRQDRTLVVVDICETESTQAADVFLQVRPGKDFELITILRALLKGQPVTDGQLAQTGVSKSAALDLVQRMKSARFGCLFFGMGLSTTRGEHMNSAALLTLAAELNAHTKFVAMPIRGTGNATGADVILRWQTGYPFGITFNRGYPRYNPGEFSTVDVLSRGDCDAALIIGFDPEGSLPHSALEHLRRIPTIVLDPQVTQASRLARVHITTAMPGITAAGTAYRMDEVPLPLKAVLKTSYPSDEQVLRRLQDAIAGKPFWLPDDGPSRLLSPQI